MTNPTTLTAQTTLSIRHIVPFNLKHELHAGASFSNRHQLVSILLLLFENVNTSTVMFVCCDGLLSRKW